jgi:DNA-3-methyladenine glycosylase II
VKSPDELAAARAELVARDPALRAADAAVGPLAWRTCPRGYEGLLWMIVGQQVSTASAAAVWARFKARAPEPTADAVLALDEAAFRDSGFSRQKTAYARAMAQAVASGAVRLDALPEDDEEAVAELVRLKGVGRWTAETYLLMGEGRLDAWPGGDIALQEAIRWADRPTPAPTKAPPTLAPKPGARSAASSPISSGLGTSA